MRIRAMPGIPMTQEEIADQCAFVSQCLAQGVDEIREDDEWEIERNIRVLGTTTGGA